VCSSDLINRSIKLIPVNIRCNLAIPYDYVDIHKQPTIGAIKIANGNGQ
jgi:hypothetical protein